MTVDKTKVPYAARSEMLTDDSRELPPFLLDELHRRDSYQILSECYYLSTADTLDKLTELQIALRRVCPEAAEYVMRMQQPIDLEELRIDHARLFVGPFRLLAAPYGSIYLEGKREVMGLSTIDARDRYLSAGLTLTDAIREAPDHIAVELEFMYYLVFKAIQALAEGDIKNAEALFAQQAAFLKAHLGAWVSDFADDVEQHASTAFYGDLARTTRLFVQNDIQYLAASLED